MEEETVQQLKRSCFFQDHSKETELQGVMPSIAKLLEEIITETTKLEHIPSSVFDAKRKPMICLLEYLDRISKYAYCSNECYVIAIILLDRIQEFHPQVIINNLNVHRLLLTSIVISIKYHDDEFFKNEYYARVGGISKQEMNNLELEFLSLINFRLFVDPGIFQLYSQKLKKYLDL